MLNSLKTPVLIEDLGYLYPTATSKRRHSFGLYLCDCGLIFKTTTYSVKRGTCSSCGCYRRHKISEALSTHGLKNHPLYSIWNSMKQRCNSTKHRYYKDYGGRGIKVCDRWLDIKNFIEDMYPTFKEGLSIDRINNDLGYSKDNCRWTTKTVQARNTRILKSTNTSGYRGVSFCKRSNKWVSSIRINKKKHIGYFTTAFEAAIAYDNYIIKNKLEHSINGVS